MDVEQEVSLDFGPLSFRDPNPLMCSDDGRKGERAIRLDTEENLIAPYPSPKTFPPIGLNENHADQSTQEKPKKD